MSTTNNNPFLLNIIPTENTITAASGLDIFATLRTDVTNIQQMVIFDEKRIAVDTINAFNNTQVEIINNVNIGSSQTNNVPDAELTVNGLPVGGSIDITTITTTITNILANRSILSNNPLISDILSNIQNLSQTIGSDLLQSNTYNYTFKPSSIGGTEIRDKVIGNPDTITNAFAKVDNWLFTNMIAPPPVSIFIGSNSTSTTCKVSFSNPYQFLTGFLAEPFPYISALYINISNADGTFSLSSNISTPSNMPFPGNSNAISNVMLTLDTNTYSSGYVSDNTYIIADAAATGKSDFVFNITWLNKNTALPTNTLSVSNLNFVSGSAASAPTGLNVTGRTNTTINLNYSAPANLNGPLLHYSNILQTFYNIPYTNSFNSASSVQPGPRRYGAAFTSNRLANLTGAPNTSFSGIAPDTAVQLVVAARNTINTTYAESAPIYSRTTLPVGPSRLGSLVFPGGNYYGTQGIPITNRHLSGQTIAPIINRNTVALGGYLTTTQLTNVAIHTASNPGSASNSIMSISCSNVGPIYFNGYGSVQAATDYYEADNNFVIKFNGSNDFYDASSGSNGFYSVGRFQFGLRRNYIAPVTAAYTFTTVQSNEYVTPNITHNTSIYVDEINASPTLLQSYNYIHTQGAGAYYFCSGVLSFNSNVVVNSTFYLSNIGAYFITYPNIGTYRVGSGSTSNILTSSAFHSDLGLTNLIGTPTTLANSNIYIGSKLFNLGNQQLFTNREDGKILNLTTGFSNILGSSGLQTIEYKIYSNASFYNIYFDVPSKSILDSMNSSNSIYGIRVTSGVNSGTDVTDFGGEFNQATSLITYSNEIQLVNGYFQTKASSTDGYINYSVGGFHNPLANSGSYTYPNYDAITSGEVRYLTVQYYITTPGSYSFFTLNIIGAINFAQDLFTGVLLSNITLQYKILDPASPDPANPGNISTEWLNGNINAVTGINNITKGISGNSGFWFNPNIKGVTYNSTSIKRYLQVTSGTGTAPFILYIRIGVPMNQNIKWRQLSVTFL